MAIGPVNFTAEQALSSNPSIFRLFGVATMTGQEGVSTSGYPNVPIERVIQTDQMFTVGVQWSVAGLLTGLIDPNAKWHVQVYFEQLGGGEINLGGASHQDVTFGTFTPIPGVTGGRQYNARLSFPPNSIPEGLYEVVCVLRLLNSSHGPGPVAGFAELGKVEFYQDR